MEVSCRRMSLFLKDTHESHDSIRKPLVRTGNRARALTSTLSNQQTVQLCAAAAYGKHTARRRTRPIVLAARGTAPRPPPVATARHVMSYQTYESTAAFGRLRRLGDLCRTCRQNLFRTSTC